MTFTNMAVNKNNSFVVRKRPGEIACIMADKIYRCCRKKQLITLQWEFFCSSELLSTPQEIIACKIIEVQVDECRVKQLGADRSISLEVCYLVKVKVIYLDQERKKRNIILEKAVLRYLHPVPGPPVSKGMAEVSLNLLHTKLDIFCRKPPV